MSTSIIYHQIALRFPKTFTGLAQDLFLIAAQAGSSNCYEASSMRRARSWQAMSFGTAEQIILRSIRTSSSCEGGALTVGSASVRITPEQYITKVRNLLKNADNHDITNGAVAFKDGFVTCQFVRMLPSIGAEPKKELIHPHDQDALSALFSDSEFMEHTQSTYAYNFTNVIGPEIRA